MVGTHRRRGVIGALAVLMGALVVLPAAAASGDHDAAAEARETPPPAALPPAGFSDVEVISGLSEAVSVAFAPDATAFVALKTGLVKSFDYTAATGTYEDLATSTDFADLRLPVNNYWDRGLTGITVDPLFGTAGHNHVYVSYTYNRDPRDNPPVVPKWGDPAEAYDECAAPASTDPPRAGCAVMMQVSRLTAEPGPGGWTMVAGSERPLLTSGCFQFGSHASGDVVFGPDGRLYASAGEGASFDTLDYGQYANPCADPVDQGGSLRSQDLRTSGDPLGVDGSVVRIDPATGLVPSEGIAGQWLVAYGQRNPWRLVFRPGTNQLWSGDVGGSSWEEINRLDNATASTSPVNRGWPCYEGAFTGLERHDGWDALDRPVCEALYRDLAAGTASVAAPYFSYRTRGPKLTPDEDCQSSTSSVSGVAFTTTGGTYPAAYRDSLFFSDFARSCIWRLGKKANGDPDPTTIIPFVQAAETPVNLEVGPGGDLYYVDYGLRPDGSVDPGHAGVHRIVYTGSGNAAPTARITAAPLSGPAPLAVSFDGRGSTDPDNDPLTYQWDLDGDGQYDDSVSPTPQRTFPAGRHTVGLRVQDDGGLASSASVEVQAGNTPPTLGAITPDASTTWSVGQTIAFSGSATDAQDGALPASAFSWQVLIRHCPGGTCHTHPMTGFSGVRSGSFVTPDHEYPSHLLLSLTVTDSGGLTATRTIRLDPRTVALTWASSPTGATVTVNGANRTTPYTETFLQGSRLTMVAASKVGSAVFSSWSDGGARVHEVSAPATPTTYTATYLPGPTAQITTSPASGPAPLTVAFDGSTSINPAGGALTYAWDLDGDWQFDDATGPSAIRTYPVGTTTVRLRVTDRLGRTARAARTVRSRNTAPTVTRLTTYPGGAYYVGQTFGFDARASDPQQDLADSAYTFIVQQQACASGCARVEVQRWAGVRTGQYLVPPMPYPSHLFLVVIVTDDHGATASSELRLDPQPVALEVTASDNLQVEVNGTLTTRWSRTLVAGTTVQLSAPTQQTSNGVLYEFVGWSDGGARTHSLKIWDPSVQIRASYRPVP